MALLGQMEMEIHAAAPLEAIRGIACLLQELDNCAIVPPVLSLEGIAKEETQETGERLENEKDNILLRRFFGCGCGGPGNGIFTFSGRRKRQTADSGNVREETQERIFNLRCVTAFVTGRKKSSNVN